MVDWLNENFNRFKIRPRVCVSKIYARNATTKKKKNNKKKKKKLTEFPGEKERWLNERWLTATPRDSKVLQMFERTIYHHSYLELVGTVS